MENKQWVLNMVKNNRAIILPKQTFDKKTTKTLKNRYLTKPQ